MSSEKTNSNAEEKMQAVKATWDKAPAGPKKDEAFKHYSAAEKAHKANDNKLCMTELNAAEKALN
ncbi:hypothetical protein [Parvularcula sp. LCG005]|uniref:hypothetical protein n=1 Tax=Parvularcula sp. LCG005 TaxID=3078805 RepID=UPI002943CD00|nr:hypothetical protein [Parvularcula sp. LCG005]WOI52187.1 hypothetical protein RUI03_08475 [Parvularcula sp. LCG005]